MKTLAATLCYLSYRPTRKFQKAGRKAGCWICDRHIGTQTAAPTSDLCMYLHLAPAHSDRGPRHGQLPARSDCGHTRARAERGSHRPTGSKFGVSTGSLTRGSSDLSSSEHMAVFRWIYNTCAWIVLAMRTL